MKKNDVHCDMDTESSMIKWFKCKRCGGESLRGVAAKYCGCGGKLKRTNSPKTPAIPI